MSDLDACPHCGQAEFARVKRWPWKKEGEPGLVWGFHVICDASGIDTHPRGCGASSGWGETPEEAIAAWSRRAAPQPAQVAVKPLDGAVEALEAASHFIRDHYEPGIDSEYTLLQQVNAALATLKEDTP